MSFKKQCQQAMCFVDWAKYSDSERIHWVFECAMDCCSNRKFYLEYPRRISNYKKQNLFGSIQKIMDHLYFTHCGKVYKCRVCQLFFVCLEDLQTHFVLYHAGSTILQADLGYPDMTEEDCNRANWLFVNFVKKFKMPAAYIFPRLVAVDAPPVTRIPPAFVTVEVGAVPLSPISSGGKDKCGLSGDHIPELSKTKESQLLSRMEDCLEIQKSGFVKLLEEMPDIDKEYIINSDHFNEIMIKIQDDALAHWESCIDLQNDSDSDRTIPNSKSSSATPQLRDL